MSEQPQFYSYTREEFIDEFVHPDDRPAVEEARSAAQATDRRRVSDRHAQKAGLTQAEVAEAMGVTQQRVSAIESRTPWQSSPPSPTTSALSAGS